MSEPSFNKYRAAIEVLQRGRDVLVEELADEILMQSDSLVEGGFLFHEFLEGQGTRIHFLSLILAQLEQSAESFTSAQAQAAPPSPPTPKPARKPRSRAKKLQNPTSAEGSAGES
jgi:hypothetical protein